MSNLAESRRTVIGGKPGPQGLGQNEKNSRSSGKSTILDKLQGLGRRKVRAKARKAGMQICYSFANGTGPCGDLEPAADSEEGTQMSALPSPRTQKQRLS